MRIICRQYIILSFEMHYFFAFIAKGFIKTNSICIFRHSTAQYSQTLLGGTLGQSFPITGCQGYRLYRGFLWELTSLEKKTKCQTAEQVPYSVHKGPMKGIIIVDGRPWMECMVDMFGISFESILALQRFNEWYSSEQSKNQKKDGN